MRIFLTSILTLLVASLFGHNHLGHWSSVENQRSDTIDIIHYEVTLDWTNSELYASCKVQYVAKMNGVNWINLDLYKLKVDSVLDRTGSSLNSNYNDSILSISTTNMNKGDTNEVLVYYHGNPWHENWGGWHKTSNYSFNLGVGFQSIPHNLGKVWHPCFDNFVERASYRVSVVTNSPEVGIASGNLESKITVGGKTTSTWYLPQKIPTYLYGIAVNDYVEIRDTIQGAFGPMESFIYAKSGTETVIKNAFRNVPDIFKAYEDRFGKYYWDRVGYVMTSIGAMEHATNIAYPVSAINDESTIAHELSHHWWGDLITCETDRDMWINEGMAVFSEYLYFESLFDDNTMNLDKEANLFSVVKNAHVQEGGYQPISGVPRVHTYGTHTYRKGSIVAHNLRRYLGDSLFFTAAKGFLDSFKFQAVNSYDFRDYFSASTGVDLKDFFDEWVFGPGMPDYQLMSWSVTPTPGLNTVEVNIHQNKAGSENLFTNVPISIRFWSADRKTFWDRTVRISKEVQLFTFQFPQAPAHIELNADYFTSYAMTSSTDTITRQGTFYPSFVDFNLDVTQYSDTLISRVQTHWAKTFIEINNQVDLGVRVNPARYWTYSNISNSSTNVNGITYYRARKGDLDEGLIHYSEDSLILLYRPLGGKWLSLGDSMILKGFVGDSIGSVIIEDLQEGDYVLAEKDPAINDSLLQSINKLELEQKLKLYPNPAFNEINVQYKPGIKEIIVLDERGRIAKEIDFEIPVEQLKLEIDKFDVGVHFVILKTNSGEVVSSRFVKTADLND